MSRKSKLDLLNSNSDFIKELSELFDDIQKASLTNLLLSIEDQDVLSKELHKLKNNIYKAQETYAAAALGPVLKKKIDDNIKKIANLLVQKDILKNLDNTSDTIDFLQELKNRFAEIADIKIANMKLSDEIGKYLTYIGSRQLKIRSQKDREAFVHNMKTIVQYRKESNFISKGFGVELDDLAGHIV